MEKITVKRQGRQWGIYQGKVLIEGGFFSYDAAEDMARDYIRHQALCGPTQEAK